MVLVLIYPPPPPLKRFIQRYIPAFDTAKLKVLPKRGQKDTPRLVLRTLEHWETTSGESDFSKLLVLKKI